MIARSEQSQIDQRNRSLPARSDDGAVAAFQFADARGQLQRRGRAVQTVGVAGFVLVPGIGYCRRVGKQNGGAAINRSVERAKAFRDFASE